MKKIIVDNIIITFWPWHLVHLRPIMSTPIAHSKDFEKMKALVSVWKGTDMGK